MKSFNHHCVFFATLRMRCRCISSILVKLQSNHGSNLNILFLGIFIFLKSLHRVPSSDSSAINKNFLLINHLLLSFKHYLYMSREHGAVSFASLKLYLIKIKTTEQNISPCSGQKKEKCRRKWKIIENILK